MVMHNRGDKLLDVTRSEKKYLIPMITMMNLDRKLSIIMNEDSNNGINGYMVRSLYFDNLNDRDFEDKVDGLDNRQKIRLRIYDSKSEYCKLELKEKTGLSQRKRSLTINKVQAYSIINRDFSVLKSIDEPLAKWLYVFMTENCYYPKCIVEYRRKAFIHEANNTRITFDTDLRASELSYDIFNENLNLYPITNIGENTLEIKYDNFLFSHIKEVINDYNLFQISNSKYCRARMISKKGRY